MTLKTKTTYTVKDFKPGDQVRHVRQQTVYTVRSVGRRKVSCSWNFYAPKALFRFKPSVLMPLDRNPKDST